MTEWKPQAELREQTPIIIEDSSRREQEGNDQEYHSDTLSVDEYLPSPFKEACVQMLSAVLEKPFPAIT